MINTLFGRNRLTAEETLEGRRKEGFSRGIGDIHSPATAVTPL
jgi:hypothetical protein